MFEVLAVVALVLGLGGTAAVAEESHQVASHSGGEAVVTVHPIQTGDQKTDAQDTR